MSIFGGLLGGSQPTKPVTQVNKVKLSPGVKSIVKPATQTLASIAANPSQLNLPAPVPFDPLQTQAQNATLAAAAGPAQTLATGAAGANNVLTNPDILMASSNPYLSSYIDAALQPITKNFTTSVLPNIRSEAISNAGLGGSRQGIAEGLATEDYLRQLGNTTAQIASQGYGQGLGALEQGINLAPGTTSLQFAPSSAMDIVGAQRRDLANQAQQANIANQYLPFITAQDVIGAANAIPGGTQGVTTVAGAPTVSGGSPLKGALGGALTGASLGSMLMPGFGTALGALGGAALGAFG